jgi:hypothetical protein
MVVDLQNSFFDKQNNEELDNIYTTKEKLWEN